MLDRHTGFHGSPLFLYIYVIRFGVLKLATPKILAQSETQTWNILSSTAGYAAHMCSSNNYLRTFF